MCAIAGLRNVHCGDILVGAEPHQFSQKHEKPSAVSSSLLSSSSSKALPLDVVSLLQAPQPIVFASVEAPSHSIQKPLEAALTALSREDPSFLVINLLKSF